MDALPLELEELRARLMLTEELVNQLFNIDLQVKDVKRSLSSSEEVSVLMHMLIKRAVLFDVERDDFLKTLAINFDEYKTAYQERVGPHTMQ